MDNGKSLKLDAHWIKKEERGASWTIRLMVWLCQPKFRWLANALLYPITAYFLLTAGEGRAASSRFFCNAKGHFSTRDHFNQLLCFAHSLMDRVAILKDGGDDFEVLAEGRDSLLEAKNKGQGVILLGAHLGNFEACKLLVKDQANLDVYIVAYFGGSQKIRKQLDAINPGLIKSVIDPTDPEAVLRMRDVIEKGGILAILGDRTGIGEKRLEVDFMGEAAYFPAGPYFLASILRCPIYCFFGLRAEAGVYHSYTIKLAEEIKLSRGQRESDARGYAQLYANHLAEKSRKYPYNWFNFFDFWSTHRSEKK